MEAKKLARLKPRAFRLSLRIRHPSLDPAEISRELRLEADHSFRAGQQRESSSGIVAASVHSESYWLGSIEPSSWLAEQPHFDVTLPGRRKLSGTALEALQSIAGNHLGMALAIGTGHLARKHKDFLRRIRSEGGEAHLLVHVFPDALEGFSLTPETGAALGELGMTVDFEFSR